MTGIMEVDASRYAVVTHAYFSNPSRSAMILGSAVPTIVWSRATRNSASMRPATATTMLPWLDRLNLPTALMPPSRLLLRPSSPAPLPHGLGEKPEQPLELRQLFSVHHGVRPPPDLLVDPRQPLLHHPPPLVGEVHADHAVVPRVALPPDETFGLERLRRARYPRRICHLVLPQELALAYAVPPPEHAHDEPPHARHSGLALHPGHGPLESPRQNRHKRLHIPPRRPAQTFPRLLVHEGDCTPVLCKRNDCTQKYSRPTGMRRGPLLRALVGLCYARRLLPGAGPRTRRR